MEIDVNLRFTLIYIWTNARIARKMFMVQQNVAIMFIYAQTFVQPVMYDVTDDFRRRFGRAFIVKPGGSHSSISIS